MKEEINLNENRGNGSKESVEKVEAEEDEERHDGRVVWSQVAMYDAQLAVGQESN